MVWKWNTSEKLKNYSVSFSCLELVLSPIHTKKSFYSVIHAQLIIHILREGWWITSVLLKLLPGFHLAYSRRSLFRGHKGMSKENTKGVLPFVPSYYLICQHGFPGGSDGQESSCNAEDLVKRSGKGNSYPLQYSCLNSMDRNLVGYSPWGGRVGHNWVTHTQHGWQLRI